jgi:preprotein translocase subunit SecA
MTGTAETEEAEFFQIYKLEVAVVPTNKPIIRDDRNDLVFKTRREKYNAIIEEAKRLNTLGFPVLIGTVSVEVSETLDRLFKREGLKPNVLNAKYHQREAEIVAEAGRRGGITIATNMAGRGTDIKLGEGVRESAPSVVKDDEGKDVEVMEIGGLHIIGSERHESRRIDRQLRGRAGRQGDPGASQFFLSLEDDLMRLFGSERIAKLMDRMGAQEGDVLTHPLITRSIEQAQKRVELQNFQSRKRLLEYDDVMNQQREVIYSLRSFALEGGEELKGEAQTMFDKALRKRVEDAIALAKEDGIWDVELLNQDLLMHYMLVVPELADSQKAPSDRESAVEAVLAAGRRAFDEKMVSVAAVGDDFLRFVMLSVLDEKWKDHLHDLDQLRNAIGYRSWGQKDPLVEYKEEAYSMFVELMADIYHTFTERFLKMQIVYQEAPPPMPPPAPRQPTKRYDAMGILRDVNEPDEPTGTDETLDVGPGEAPAADIVTRQDPLIVGSGKARPLSSLGTGMTGGTDGNGTGNGKGTDWESVGRNDPCPCGSGKKFKKCHGARV